MAKNPGGPSHRRWKRLETKSVGKDDITVRLWPGCFARMAKKRSVSFPHSGGSPKVGALGGRGTAAGGSMQLLNNSRVEAKSTSTYIVSLGSPSGPPPDPYRKVDLAERLVEGSEVLLAASDPENRGRAEPLAVSELPSHPSKSPFPTTQVHIYSDSSDARGAGSLSSTGGVNPVTVGRVGRVESMGQPRSETPASDSDNPQCPTRMYEVPCAGAEGESHPSMRDWSPEPYKTGEPWNQSRDDAPFGGTEVPSCRVVEGVHINPLSGARGNRQHHTDCDLTLGHGLTCVLDSRTQGVLPPLILINPLLKASLVCMSARQRHRSLDLISQLILARSLNVD